MNILPSNQIYHAWFQWLTIPVAARSKAWVYGRSLAGIVGSNPVADMDLSFVSGLLSGRGLYNGLITRPEESYRVWYVYISVIVKPVSRGCFAIGKESSGHKS
jgi:hypothetical protein